VELTVDEWTIILNVPAEDAHPGDVLGEGEEVRGVRVWNAGGVDLMVGPQREKRSYEKGEFIRVARSVSQFRRIAAMDEMRRGT